MTDFPEGAEGIGRIMGTSVEGAYETLRGMYGDDIAMEVLRIGRIWERDTLTRRERSFVAIAALVAMGTKERLRIHVQGAINHGATPEEVCAKTIRLLRDLGVRNVYVSNLPVGRARATLEKIGALMGVTRERIRQIRERAFDKLRTSPEGRSLAGFWAVT